MRVPAPAGMLLDHSALPVPKINRGLADRADVGEPIAGAVLSRRERRSLALQLTAATSLMGGYFVLENLQVVGQYSFVSKPQIQGEPPPTIPELPTAAPSAFHAFGVGLSYFVIPGHDNVKLSTDFQYFLGREMGSTVPASPLNNIQPNDDGSQFFWRVQLSAAF